MSSSIRQSDSNLEFVVCPNCAAKLLKRSGVSALLCANCHTQFRLDGPWPRIHYSQKAIASFGLGMLSCIGFFVTGIPAFVLGVCALNDIRRQPNAGTLRGWWFAIIGATFGGLLSTAILFGPFFVVRLQRSTMAEQGSGSVVRQSIANNVVPIVPHGAEWKWLHPVDGVDPEVHEPGFHERFYTSDYDDSAWQTGTESRWLTGFGYGDPVAKSIGEPASGKRNTAYFRARFRTRQNYRGLIFACYRDDGIVVYIDGKEVARDNMPDAPDSYQGTAAAVIGSDAETAMIGIKIPEGLPAGEHVLAISVHNASPSSSDLRLGNVRLYGTL